MGLDTEVHRANVENISVEHTTRLAAAPGVLSLATTKPEGSDVCSIPTCGPDQVDTKVCHPRTIWTS